MTCLERLEQLASTNPTVAGILLVSLQSILVGAIIGLAAGYFAWG